jgi:alpha-beta hydrolase superfamily lysophospholipase
MENGDTTFTGAGGLELYRQAWLPTGSARALLVIVHGFGEHMGRYGNVVDALVPRGCALAGYDLRGHGRSEGPRGLVMSWAEYRRDLARFLELMSEEHPGLPVFLYGHSMGGLIALEYALRHPEGLRGVIASAPAVGPPGVSPVLLFLSRILSAAVPRFTLSANLDETAISRDPEVVRAYEQDPLVHDRATARLGTEMTKAADRVQERAADFKLPLLVIHGDQDRLISPEDSRRFFEHSGSEDKTYRVVPGGFHEPHNDLEAEQVLEDVARWLEAHL